MRNERIRGTVASEPSCAEIEPHSSDEPMKKGFLLGIRDGTKQVWCRMGPGFRGSLPTVGALVELIGAYIGGDFSFDQISVLSSHDTPLPP
jgi:hypothetical protein